MTRQISVHTGNFLEDFGNSAPPRSAPVSRHLGLQQPLPTDQTSLVARARFRASMRVVRCVLQAADARAGQWNLRCPAPYGGPGAPPPLAGGGPNAVRAVGSCCVLPAPRPLTGGRRPPPLPLGGAARGATFGVWGRVRLRTYIFRDRDARSFLRNTLQYLPSTSLTHFTYTVTKKSC